MNLHRNALALACTLLLAACLPVTSKTPVGSTTGLGADQALYGTWKGYSDDHAVSYVHFIKKKDEGIAAIWVTPNNGDEDGGVGLFLVKTSKLGANSFIDILKSYTVKEDAKNESDDTFLSGLNDSSIPMLYRLGKNRTLTLYLLDEDKTKEAIQAGKLAGSVESGNFGDVKITADAAALDAFMATPEAVKLFKVFLVLKKAD